ncbi:MAG: hypothetical protein ACE367_14190 [Acidimicrobiales bacterium]
MTKWMLAVAAINASSVPAAMAQPEGGGATVGSEVTEALALEDLSPQELAQVQRNRDHFGLPADVDTIADRLDTADAEQAMAVFGMPLSEDEFAVVAARQQFGIDVEPLLQWVQEHPEYAGAAFRLGRDGGLDVYVTTDALAAEVRKRGEALGLDHPIAAIVVEHSWQELQKVMDDAWAAAPEEVHSVGIDTSANRVTVEIHQSVVDRAEVRLDIEEAVDVPVTVTAAPAPDAQACNNRQDCWAPKLRPGVRLTMGSRVFDVGRRCTMGFHVRVDGTNDEQFLTAGHCARATSASVTSFRRAYHWSLPGVAGDQGRIGTQVATAFVTASAPNYGFDVARFQMPDKRATDRIYRISPSTMKIVTNLRYPRENDYICFSPSVSRNVAAPESATLSCGRITVEDTYWTISSQNNNCGNCRVRGARHDVGTTTSGDSGAPVWYPVLNLEGPAQARPVGLHVTSLGGMTRIHDALVVLNAHIALTNQ